MTNEQQHANVLYKWDPAVPDNLSGVYREESRVLSGALAKSDRQVAYSKVLAVTQHVASIVMFVGIFLCLYNDLVETRTLFVLTIVLYISGCSVIAARSSVQSALQSFGSGIILGIILFTLAPVLKTLTRSTTDDSIWALSSGLFMFNALLTDYTPSKWQTNPGKGEHRLASALSLNAAISAAVVLASRLDSNSAVFVFLWLALAWFLMFPLALASFPPILSTIFVVVSAQALLYPTSTAAAVFFTISTAILGFLTPAALLWARRFHRTSAQRWIIPHPAD